jgi:hypothetical protein
MRHIEFSECNLTIRAVEGQIIHKTIIGDILNNTAVTEDFTPDYMVEDEDEDEGGVSLLECAVPDDAGLTSTQKGEASPTVIVPSWPALLQSSVTGNTESTLLGDAPWGGSSSKVLFPEARTSSNQLVPSADTQTNLLHDQLWNPESEMYQADAFYSTLFQRYICPFTTCK